MLFLFSFGNIQAEGTPHPCVPLGPSPREGGGRGEGQRWGRSHGELLAADPGGAAWSLTPCPWGSASAPEELHSYCSLVQPRTPPGGCWDPGPSQAGGA